MESKGWGGKRQGAGRKPGPNIRVTLSVPREIWDNIGQQSKSKGLTPEELTIHLLAEALNSRQG